MTLAELGVLVTWIWTPAGEGPGGDIPLRSIPPADAVRRRLPFTESWVITGLRRDLHPPLAATKKTGAKMAPVFLRLFATFGTEALQEVLDLVELVAFRDFYRRDVRVIQTESLVT